MQFLPRANADKDDLKIREEYEEGAELPEFPAWAAPTKMIGDHCPVFLGCPCGAADLVPPPHSVLRMKQLTQRQRARGNSKIITYLIRKKRTLRAIKRQNGASKVLGILYTALKTGINVARMRKKGTRGRKGLDPFEQFCASHKNDPLLPAMLRALHNGRTKEREKY